MTYQFEVKNKIANYIYSDWLGTPQERICLKLLDYIVSLNPSSTYYLTYGGLYNVIGRIGLIDDLIKSINYLCSSKIDLLKTNLEYIGPNDDIGYPLEQVEGDNDLYHPETGELITNMDYVYPYFTPTDKAKSLSVYNQ